MTSRPRRAVATATTAALAAATLLLTGCSATNPITTQNNYAASDGSHVELGDLRLGNLIVLSTGQGAPGVVVGSVTNDAGEATRVTIAVAGAEAGSFRVDGRQTVLLGQEDGETLEVESVEEPAGAFVDLTVSSDAGSTTVGVPVLDGSLPEYAELTPSADED